MNETAELGAALPNKRIVSAGNGNVPRAKPVGALLVYGCTVKGQPPGRFGIADSESFSMENTKQRSQYPLYILHWCCYASTYHDRRGDHSLAFVCGND